MAGAGTYWRIHAGFLANLETRLSNDRIEEPRSLRLLCLSRAVPSVRPRTYQANYLI
jgi:hypothetical protein